MSTSNRRQAFAQPQSNPATKFIDWKSNDKNFSYFDKNLAESMKGASKDEIKEKCNIPINLPFKFLALDELSTVKGWNESLKGSIGSNEVRYISKEILNVVTYHKDGNGKSSKTELIKGIYSDIKDKIKSSGAHYVKSIYIMLEDGSLANLQLKGAACQSWGDFTKKNRTRLPDEWVTVKKAIEGKKGAVKFYTPDFSFDKSLSESEIDLADEAFGILEVYLKAYLVKADPTIAEVEEEVEDPIDEDHVDF